MKAMQTPAFNWRALLGVAALHLLLLLALIVIRPAAEVAAEPQALMVSLLSAPEPAAPVEPPKPLPASATPTPAPQTQPLPTAPLLTARSTKPIAAEMAPAPVVENTLIAKSEPAAAPVAAPASTQPVAPAPLSQPRFDADYLDNPAPAYPPLSRKLGEFGQVTLRVFVSADGQADKVEIRESSGYERLDRAARDAVSRWRFVPARQGDKEVAAWVLVPVSFSIRS